ncbi:MAG TPA: hypothetical protein VFY49_18570 [Myxococcota bacterium]|nr:hypothetical protein [Myxococcota bacterium]
MSRAALARIVCAASVALFAAMLLPRLSSPLLWHDEGDTAMFATRILEVGYPKVHGSRNVLYEFGARLSVGVEESVDAYIGKTWGDYYYAVPGVWWAAQTDDPAARTFRVRLPFALAGAAGVGVWLWGVLPALPRGRRALFAAAYFACSALSISLILHLREARYYPLLVLVLGAAVAVHLRGIALRALAWRRYALATALLLPILFQVFYVAWFPLLAWCAADAALAAWRRGDGTRTSRVARALTPLALGALLTVPALVFFETFGVATRFASEQGAGPARWGANALGVVAHFLRHEWLAAAIATRALAAWLVRRAPAHARASTRPQRALSARLLAFAACYAAFGCLNPLVYERYFVALSPALALAFLLDAFACADLLATAPRAWRRAAAAGLAFVVAGSLAARRDALAGHLRELRAPVQGPLDFAVAHLRERYADPSTLLVATNYEAQPLMFYLGSRVIVGLAQGDIGRERGLEPDVVIPRRRWPRSLASLRGFVARGRWEEVRLPVEDTHYNEVPSLTSSAATPDPHRFETPHADPQAAGSLRVLHRIKPTPPRLAPPGGPATPSAR